MCLEDTNGKIIGPPIEVKCKIDTDSRCKCYAHICVRTPCPVMFDSSGKTLKKFDALYADFSFCCINCSKLIFSGTELQFCSRENQLATSLMQIGPS